MAKNAVLDVKGGSPVEAVSTFLKSLFDKKVLDALLVPLDLPAKNMVVPTLVSDPEMLKYANPLAPVMPVSSARMISRITKVAASKRKVGVVLRPCEHRALIELVKLKQASLGNLIVIGMECFGTYSVSDYGKFCQETATPTSEFLKKVKNGEALNLRESCQVCEYPASINADLVIGVIGADLHKNIFIQASTSEGERILEQLELREGTEEEEKKRQVAISELLKLRTENKNKLFSQIKAESTGLDNLESMFADCINCHNCRVACPLCYCRECFFDSPTFDWGAEKYLSLAEKKGALKMPTDNLLYHLTRLNHMAASCVGCGLCQEACPNEIPVFRLFRMVGEQVQKTFDYVPGRSVEEELPLSVFKEDELKDVGT